MVDYIITRLHRPCSHHHQLSCRTVAVRPRVSRSASPRYRQSAWHPTATSLSDTTKGKLVLTGRVEPRQLSSPGVLRSPARRRAACSRPVLIPVRILLRHGPVPDVGLGEKWRRHNSCPLPALLPPALAFSYDTSIIGLSRLMAAWLFCLSPGLRCRAAVEAERRRREGEPTDASWDAPEERRATRKYTDGAALTHRPISQGLNVACNKLVWSTVTIHNVHGQLARP